jgi:hypothetical protein
MSSRLALSTFALLFILASSLLHARVINIPDDFETIQAAIDSSSDGDTVLVAPGEYVENINFSGRAITVASLLLVGGGEVSIDSTIINGNQRGSVVRFDHEEDENSLLIGFTLTNGTGSDDLSGDVCGGGIHCLRSSPTLKYLKIHGNSAEFGSGVFLQHSSPTLEFIQIYDNSATVSGGGLYCSRAGTEPLVTHTIIHHNRSQRWAGGVMCLFRTRPRFDRVTIVNNIAGGNGGGIVCNSSDGENGNHDQNHVSLNNSILRANEPNQIAIGTQHWGCGDTLIFSYSDIDSGQDAFDRDGGRFLWLDGNIDEDPLFVDPDAWDYRLQDDSPCRDAGDPDGELDPDGSRADMGMGWFPYCPPFNAYVSGQVLDSETDLPIAGANVLGHGGRHGFFIRAESDSLGIWGSRLLVLSDSVTLFQFDVTAARYLRSSTEVEAANGDSVWFETRLDHGEFLSSPDNLAVEVDSGGFAQAALTIRNEGNGLLTWQVNVRARGDAGYAPWTLRQSLPVAEITGDNRIEGVVFDGESYYCAGRGDADQNLIYRLDHDGVLLDSFPQPGHSQYRFRDMEWDGELIWGSGEDTVYAINRDEEVVHRWRGQINPIHNIAFDPAGGILWLSSITRDIFAYDREGNYLDRSIDRQSLRIYGLAWFANDPDSACLYALNNPGGELPPQISKFNPLTGEMRLVHSFAQDSSADLRGAFICRNYDSFQNWVLLTVANISPDDGGDQIQVRQLQQNKDWLIVVPDSGEVPAGEESQVTVNLCTAAEDGDWAFELGEYDGEIVFTHDGFGAETILPVHLTVVEPSAAPGRPVETPALFGITGVYPNPFNAVTQISYSLQQAGYIELAVFDLTGRQVDVIEHDFKSGGYYITSYDASSLPSGVYILSLTTTERSSVRKMLLIK